MKHRFAPRIAGLLLAATVPAWAQNGADDGRMARLMGPLAATIENTPAATGWELFFTEDWLVLVNDATASSELFYTMPLPPLSGAEPERTTSLAVGVLPPEGSSSADFPYSAVGLFIESPDGSTSCVGEITGSGDGVALCFGADGKATEVGRLPGAAKGNGQDLLQFWEEPNHGDFYLNGELLAHLENIPAIGGNIGILAYERGEFFVGGFTIEGGGELSSNETPAPRSRPQLGYDAIRDMFGDENKLIGVYMGVINSIFRHEFGHALINELLIPSTGPEEDAVDIFSALLSVEPTTTSMGDADVDAMVREAATYSALQWYYSGLLLQQQGVESPWQDEHTPDLRRFRNMFCILYGGNVGAFATIASQLDLDERTLSRCDEEFNKQNRAWRTILAPHTRLNSWHPEGQLPASAPGATIEVNFEPSSSEVGEFVRQAFAESITTAAADLASIYALPRPLRVTYRDCGELNAWYDPREGTITMCYDLIENLIFMIASVETGTDVTAPAPAPGANNAGTALAPTASGIDELADLGIPVMSVLFPPPYQGSTPVAHARAELLTTTQLLALLNAGSPLLLIDTSGSAQTIAGALPVVDIGKDGSITDSFQLAVNDWLNETTGGDQSLPIVLFGAGLQDRSSYNAALRAGALGWKALWYRGGLEAWRANGLPLVDLDAPQAQEEPQTVTETDPGVADRFAFYDGIDFFGGDFDQVRVEEAAQCLQICLENTQCKAVTVNLSTRSKSGPNCFLKDGYERVEFYEEAVSGVFLAPTFDGVLTIDGVTVNPSDIIELGQ